MTGASWRLFLWLGLAGAGREVMGKEFLSLIIAWLRHGQETWSFHCTGSIQLDETPTSWTLAVIRDRNSRKQAEATIELT